MTCRAWRLDWNREYRKLYRDRGENKFDLFIKFLSHKWKMFPLLNVSLVKLEVLIRVLVVSRSATGGGGLSLTCLSCWVDLDVVVSLRPLMISAQGLISAFCPQTLSPQTVISRFVFSPLPFSALAISPHAFLSLKLQVTVVLNLSSFNIFIYFLLIPCFQFK